MIKYKIHANSIEIFQKFEQFMRVSNELLVSINYANCLFSYSNFTIILNSFAQFVIKITSKLNETLYKRNLDTSLYAYSILSNLDIPIKIYQ